MRTRRGLGTHTLIAGELLISGNWHICRVCIRKTPSARASGRVGNRDHGGGLAASTFRPGVARNSFNKPADAGMTLASTVR